ncbi:hypothetical protein LSH36_1006g00037 [Paralvinella palmiformis]|uniref:EGF-like domain-containing protein n=1 Tax=Paralvinella palmiformis TaxID=53620 RepID=A0AAD9MQA9_9ANNE|nr:hypothetical protein LSH36_1006g00037 [Paralvinella palmiformis]
MTLSGYNRKTIVETLHTYADINLDPLNRYIYWSNDNHQIRRVTYDGENDTIIVNDTGSYDISMTIDVRGGLIYWIRDCDCSDYNIHVVDVDGNYLYAYDDYEGLDPVGTNNPCSSSPCQHGGTCKVYNDNDDFICQCQSGWFGKSCQYDQLLINTIRPLYGPVAGGTNITIEGIDFPIIALDVLIGETVRGIIISTNSTTIIAETDRVDSSYVGSKLSISVKFEGNLVLSTSYSFEFKGNPKIKSLFPLETLTQTRRAIEKLDSGSDTKVPESHVSADDTLRLKREADIIQIETIYIGLVLDGLADYKNLSDNEETKSFGKMKIVKSPTFGSDALKQKFKFKSKQQLDIKGKDLDHILIIDYTVNIGLGSCEIFNMTSNTLYCMPPQKEPLSDKTSTRHRHDIIVHIGQNVAEVIGEITYPNKSNMYIGIGCAGILLIVILALILVHLLRKSQKSPRNDDVLSMINLPPVENKLDE